MATRPQIVKDFSPTTLFTTISTVTLTGSVSTAETSIIGTTVGSLVIPAFTLKPGSGLRIDCVGSLSIVTAHNFTLKAKIGGVIFTSLTASASLAAASGNGLQISVFGTCRTAGAAGTVQGNGMFTWANNTHNILGDGLVSTLAVIDTTIANTIDLTWQWLSAAGTNTVNSAQVIGTLF